MAALTGRQVDVLREAARVRRLVSVVQHPDGRLEDVAGSGWNGERVPLPSEVEVRELARAGYLERVEPRIAASFYVTDDGLEAVR